MENKKLRIIIDKVGEVDTNGILFTEKSITSSDGEIVPVFKYDYRDEEEIGNAMVKFEDDTKSLIAKIEFVENFNISELIGKNLAPKYTVQNEDMEKIDGVIYIKKAKLESVSVITNIHASNIKPITQQDIEDGKEK